MGMTERWTGRCGRGVMAGVMLPRIGTACRFRADAGTLGAGRTRANGMNRYLLLLLVWIAHGAVFAQKPPDPLTLCRETNASRSAWGLDTVDARLARADPAPLRVLISFNAGRSIDDAVAWATANHLTILGFGHQSADHFGAYVIPDGVALDDAIVAYRQQFRAFHQAALPSQLGEIANSEGVPDEVKASARRQLQALPSGSKATDPQVTGLYAQLSAQDAVALRQKVVAERMSVEIWSPSRTSMPLMLCDEYARALH
ncbi:MAG: hypothetical protein JSR18_07450 [Proteobacteria bacterium]|nr:hypothetical protein [Pseudomonadota bacterium]